MTSTRSQDLKIRLKDWRTGFKFYIGERIMNNGENLKYKGIMQISISELKKFLSLPEKVDIINIQRDLHSDDLINILIGSSDSDFNLPISHKDTCIPLVRHIIEHRFQ